MTDGTLAGLTAEIRRFVDARDWRQFHNPKNLVLALTGEVGELAAELQWLTAQQAAGIPHDPAKHEAVRSELADVAIYLLRLADELGVDLDRAVVDKLRANEERYAAPAVRGRAEKR